MLESLFTNVFGRPKNKSSSRNSQGDASNVPNSNQMTGPFSMSTPQMPQPPSSMYPPAPYPPAGSSSIDQPASYYPSLPFSQPPAMPQPYGGSHPSGMPSNPYGTIVSKQWNPLDSVPFEAKLSLDSSSNFVSLDQLFKDIKRAADAVERADTYLKSNQSDYRFETERELILQW